LPCKRRSRALAPDRRPVCRLSPFCTPMLSYLAGQLYKAFVSNVSDVNERMALRTYLNMRREIKGRDRALIASRGVADLCTSLYIDTQLCSFAQIWMRLRAATSEAAILVKNSIKPHLKYSFMRVEPPLNCLFISRILKGGLKNPRLTGAVIYLDMRRQ
jgi:hypothetical protein